jgi:energy-coupling factor transporter transmembrane protein EcfT
LTINPKTEESSKVQFDTGHIRDAEKQKNSCLDAFDPRCRVICALALSAALACARSLPDLAAGGIVPFLLLFAGSPAGLAKALAHVNAVTVFIWFVLPFTVPGVSSERAAGVFFVEGLRLALLTTCKLNLISIVLIRMVAELGMGRIAGVLGDFRVPEKMRVLLLLTTRYVFLLTERVAAMARAVRLRAPGLRGRRMCSAFACMLGTTLVHSSDRAERSMLAMRCRAGSDTLRGFSQCRTTRWGTRDTALCLFFAASAAAVAAACLSR